MGHRSRSAPKRRSGLGANESKEARRRPRGSPWGCRRCRRRSRRARQPPPPKFILSSVLNGSYRGWIEQALARAGLRDVLGQSASGPLERRGAGACERCLHVRFRAGRARPNRTRGIPRSRAGGDPRVRRAHASLEGSACRPDADARARRRRTGKCPAGAHVAGPPGGRRGARELADTSRPKPRPLFGTTSRRPEARSKAAGKYRFRTGMLGVFNHASILLFRLTRVK